MRRHPRKGAGMLVLTFALLILMVCALLAIPLALDDDLRENMKFWGVPILAGVVI